MNVFDQASYDLKCEWGLDGLRAVQSHADVLIVVDVLSFSTAVNIAVSRGAFVFPFRWRDESAARFAAEKGAILAGSRRSGSEYSLSPASLVSIAAGTRLVLPSANGSTLSFEAGGTPLFTACLRNAPAVARAAARHGSRIAVIAAGEGWPGGALRPSLEDLAGAGAVLSELPGTRSPEAEWAIATFSRFRNELPAALVQCASGRELIEKGFPMDVELAAEYAVSSAAPMLDREGKFAVI
jgi:2-phosphosulfolactate phosphatase